MTGVSQTDILRLSVATPREAVRQRQGPGGRMLDYVDARFVMDRLDQLGPGNWQDKYEDRPNGSVRCYIGINIEGVWVWKGDVGDESDIEADKGAHSGAFKRAGVKWGIARDLYGLASSQSSGRVGSSPARPPAPPRPTVVRDDGPEEPPDLFPPIGGSVAATVPTDHCPLHDVPWIGTPGDYWHKDPEGKYCRHPDNVKRRAR